MRKPSAPSAACAAWGATAIWLLSHTAMDSGAMDAASEVASEASWAPGSAIRGAESAHGSDSLRQQLLLRKPVPVRPRRDSIQGDDPYRLPMRVHLERWERLIARADKLLVPVGIVLCAVGGILLATGTHDPGVALLVAGAACVGIAIFISLVYASALAPYAIFMARSTRDPLSCVRVGQYVAFV